MNGHQSKPLMIVRVFSIVTKASRFKAQISCKKIMFKVGEEAGEHLGGMVEEGGAQLAGPRHSLSHHNILNNH